MTMRTSAREFDDESRAVARFNGARTLVMHVLCARSASKSSVLRESLVTACLSLPYAPIVWLREGLFASTMWPTRSICEVILTRDG